MSASTPPTNADGLVPAPFVVGAGGSGTTTLRLMLDSHPQLAVPPETHFLPTLAKRAERPGVTPADVAAVIHGDPRWGDFGFTREELEEVMAPSNRSPAPAWREPFTAATPIVTASRAGATRPRCT